MPGQRSIQFLDHTADLQARLQAESSEGLFELGAQLLFELLTDQSSFDIECGTGAPIELCLEAADPAELFARWLEELVFLLDARGLAPLSAQVTLDLKVEGAALSATVIFVRIEALRAVGLELRRIPKAVTRHKLRFEGLPSGQWLAEVVFDV